MTNEFEDYYEKHRDLSVKDAIDECDGQAHLSEMAEDTLEQWNKLTDEEFEDRQTD